MNCSYNIDFLCSQGDGYVLFRNGKARMGSVATGSFFPGRMTCIPRRLLQMEAYGEGIQRK
jgi:hypothetical protein